MTEKQFQSANKQLRVKRARIPHAGSNMKPIGNTVRDIMANVKTKRGTTWAI